MTKLHTPGQQKRHTQNHISKKLRAEISPEQWLALSKKLPDVEEVSMDEMVSEVKAVRRGGKWKLKSLSFTKLQTPNDRKN